MAVSRRPRLYDTNVYIAAIRAGETRALSGPLVWLSMVVAFELLAGTKSSAERADVLRLVDASRRRDRLLVPTEREWARAGEMLASYGRLHGHLQPSHHVTDVLITLAAARVAGEVVTHNLDDFRRWARLARRAGADVVVADPMTG